MSNFLIFQTFFVFNPPLAPACIHSDPPIATSLAGIMKTIALQESTLHRQSFHQQGFYILSITHYEQLGGSSNFNLCKKSEFNKNCVK